MRFQKLTALLPLLGVSALNTLAINYWDITSISTGQTTGSANGTIAGIQLEYSGEAGGLSSVGLGTDYWASDAAYIDVTVVIDGPSIKDFIQLDGGSETGQNTLTFSQPVTNPVMLILSLGQNSVPASFVFSAAPIILHEGQGHFGNGSLSVSGNTLFGNEGHGSIQFIGTFTSISWTNPEDENWYGFTVALPDQVSTPEGGATLALMALGIGLLSSMQRKTPVI